MVIIKPPAPYTSVNLDPTGVVQPHSHALEGVRWCAGLAVSVVAPALHAAAAVEPARMVVASTHAFEAAGGGIGDLTVPVSTPAHHVAITLDSAGEEQARTYAFEAAGG
mgnify:CR=1 FL=1